MKLLIILTSALALGACGPAPEAWKDTPNPLDQPATGWKRAEAEGEFGHGWMLDR